jgi:diguanylate cyclase (GGDEF)-like protein
MSEPEQQSVREEPREAVGLLIRAGRFAEAIDEADRLLAGLTEDHDVVGVVLAKLSASLNLNRLPPLAELIDAAWARLDRPGADPAQVAEFHSLAADTAYRMGSLDRCVSHLVHGSRALEQIPDERPMVRAWVNTATAYSFVGFHKQALAALGHAQKVARFASADDAMMARHPEVLVRYAAFLDQQGDSQGARGVLDGVVGLGPEDVTVLERSYLGYAIARRLLLDRLPDAMPGPGPGAPSVQDARALLEAGPDSIPEANELRRFGAAVLAVLGGEPQEALPLLDDLQDTHTRLGRAEAPRLKTFAHTALEDYRAAFEAQCEVTSMLARSAKMLYDMFVDGITTRIDYDELLRSNLRHADEARTDPLTGLPNRRYLEQHVAELIERGARGTIAVADIDRFKDVNTEYGHLVGDQVLRQVAAILYRTLRSGDFLARFGGDEFVAVLPESDPTRSQALVERMRAAVADHSWELITPDLPITITVGTARLGPGQRFADAFSAADLMMLRGKGRTQE